MPLLQQWVITIRRTKSVTYLLPTVFLCVCVCMGGMESKAWPHLTSLFHKRRDKGASCSSLANQPYLYKNTTLFITSVACNLLENC